jgi:mannose/fructose/N-acetylgalactosamine-specific phosphotransferase system component IIC
MEFHVLDLVSWFVVMWLLEKLCGDDWESNLFIGGIITIIWMGVFVFGGIDVIDILNGNIKMEWDWFPKIKL